MARPDVMPDAATREHIRRERSRIYKSRVTLPRGGVVWDGLYERTHKRPQSHPPLIEIERNGRIKEAVA